MSYQSKRPVAVHGGVRTAAGHGRDLEWIRGGRGSDLQSACRRVTPFQMGGIGQPRGIRRWRDRLEHDNEQQ
jgi:hypothetical protein